jgi:peptide-methionine (S)-S-oxide reductase
MKKEIIVLGGGCFWCIDAIFRKLKGVSSVESGYAGGTKENPTYSEVSSEKTGHAEVIKVEFDPEIISFEKILWIFFAAHDPTTLNRQGADVGTRYRSTILYTTDIQREIAEQVVQNLENSKEYSSPIVTTIEPLREFYSAESYHQEYFENNQGNMYCSIVIAPKLNKILKEYSDLT